ncbi:uncharacterized protein LOC116290550 [Actinia tenebrosa]|uniref:Uncharacterized protein LOC116290550 n=1 Tax=Actinia tenebrosa TaxID=6105 RepID=A0A6P8HLB7_ACTTE|nr:uncharacterized protein LOC116290550 [Actinia tenebrosa]
MSQRSSDQIKKDLVAAGVDAKTADKFKNAVGLKGKKARDWLKKNNLQDFTLTHEQQKKLFEKDYPRYVSKAKRLVEKYSKAGVKFDSLSQVAKDIATDIMYRGDYSMSSRNPAKKKRSKRIQKVLDSKSLQKLKDLMSDKKFWDAAGVDPNRFNERKKAVEAACKKDPNCN